MLLKAPTVSLVCVLTLGVAIGGNTAVFSIVNALLLRPLPFPELERLVAVPQIDLRDGHRSYISMPDFISYENGADSFQSLAGYFISSFNLNNEGISERLEGSLVTRQFFYVIGVAAGKGRTFSPSDPDGTVVISYSLWQRKFHGNPDSVGRPVLLDGHSATVVGVMPPGFWFPQLNCQLWRLITPDSYLVRGNEDYHFLRAIGRLKRKASSTQALAQLKVVNDQLIQAHPDVNSNLAITVLPLAEDLSRNVRASILVLMAAVTFVVLIACANVASLLLSRLLRRSKEFAIRMALGANRLQLFRQLLMESVLLSISGGALGLVLAFVGVQLTMKFNPTVIPRFTETRIDPWVLLFTLMVSALTGLICALVPVSQLLAPGFTGSLNEQGGRATSGKTTRILQQVLIGVEVATALMLLVAVNLMTESFLRLAAVDLGFNTDRLLTVRVRLQKANYPSTRELEAFQRQIYESISASPGVRAVATSSYLPLVGGFENYFSIRGEAPIAPARRELVMQASVSPGYFRVMGIPLRSGREFSEFDSQKTDRVAIVDETMARRFWPRQNPLERQIRHGTPDEPTQWYTVVGVVKGTVPAIGFRPIPTIFTPFAQIPEGYEDFLARPITIFVRADNRNLNALIPGLRAVIAGIDPDLASEMRTMDEVLSGSLAESKFRAVALGVFGAVALWLSAIGIYGVVSTATSSETRNIGIRMSLGARSRDVLLFVIGRGMLATALGLAFGMSLAFLLTRFMRTLLYEVSATDPKAFVAAAAVLLLASLLATYLPARHATRVDPVIALRVQ
jgi:putative ABC transport system permease protein